MIPVFPIEQRGNDDCYDACLASIFHLPMIDLPRHRGTDWIGVYHKWLVERGYKLRLAHPDEGIPPGYYIGAFESLRGPHLHAVVMFDGKVIWDPHPQRAMGLGELKRHDILDPIGHDYLMEPAFQEWQDLPPDLFVRLYNS